MNEVANPYRPGQPVVDPAMLFGRQDVADWIERQIKGGERLLLLSGMPLIGKTSVVRHVNTLQNLQRLKLLVTLSASMSSNDLRNEQPHVRKIKAELQAINVVLQSVIDQLVPQLTNYDLVELTAYQNTATQTTSVLQELFSQASRRLGQRRLVFYIDDLHLLLTDDTALAASFLTALAPLLDECSQLHFVFTSNHDQLKYIKHPLLDGAPIFNLRTLATDASLRMVTEPVRNVLNFDYGVTKRIIEVNSHHPYFLTLFCHALLNRYAQDGWVNQRDFDATLALILGSPIEPFSQIWGQSTGVERAVLTGMAAMQGRHGPMTQQEIVHFLQRHNSSATSAVILKALHTLAERGVLVPMGAVSYRFQVELLRLWLREHTDFVTIVKEVNWMRLASQSIPQSDSSAIGQTATASQSIRDDSPSTKRRLLWPMLATVTLLLCLLVTVTVLATQYLDLPLFLLTAQTTPTPTATPEEESTEADSPTATVTVEATATNTPTPALVVARTLPSITYMGKDVDQSWRIYVMDANGSGAIPLTSEGADNTAPTWSADGQKIALVSQRDGNREIYVMDADGQNAVNVTRHPADDWTPAWSPDGSQLAFSSIRTGGWEIFVMDTACLDTPETCPDSVTQITADGNSNISPVWSPDSSHFAFNSKATDNWDIYTMATDGSDIRQVTTSLENDLAPAWSPDGSRIAFETNRDGNVEIYVVDANGGSAQNITNLSLANDHGPTWSPDGQQLVFYSNREGNWDIFSTTLDGELVTNLTQTPSRDEQTPAWRP